MNKRVVAVLLAGVMAVSMLTACGSQKTEETAAPEEPQVENDGQETSDSAYPMTFDNYGREVTITQKPQKVLTLGPNCTELFAAIDRSIYADAAALSSQYHEYVREAIIAADAKMQQVQDARTKATVAFRKQCAQVG